MLFDSLPFLIFLPLVVGLYYLLPHRFRWMLLLVASYFFYGSWKWEFLILIAWSTLVDYFVALRIGGTKEKVRKRLWLTLSILSNFGVLFIFKYFNFFIGSRGFFQQYAADHPTVDWMTGFLEYGIPVGISFYTFQTVGYTIDVYYNKVRPERHLGKFALFVSYFPQLVAGPIERFSHLHKQILEPHKLIYENLSRGFRLILYGLFIKMVIADNLAPLADSVFDNPLNYSQTDNILGLFFFSIQIYADFHGYSLIAIGVARLMGVELMDNFRTPYFSSSVKEFWSRWHISLSTWFRDYLYLPLGGNKVRYFRWMVNIMIVFIVSGIWHGANFTFIIWGAIHGFIYLTEQIVFRWKKPKTRNGFLKIPGWIYTFLVVNLAWLFFRSDTLSKAYLSICQILGLDVSRDRYYSIQAIEHSQSNLEIDQLFLQGGQLKQLDVQPGVIIILGLFFLIESGIYKNRFDMVIGKLSFAMRWSVYAVLIYLVMALSGSDFYQFIYFQF